APPACDARGGKEHEWPGTYVCEECQPMLAVARRSAVRSCSGLRSKRQSSVAEDAGISGCAAQPTTASACTGRPGRPRDQASRRAAKRETAGSRAGNRTPRRRLAGSGEDRTYTTEKLAVAPLGSGPSTPCRARHRPKPPSAAK